MKNAFRVVFVVSLLVAAFAVGMLGPQQAVAWFADFFDGGASGQAVYEDMAIHPQAVRSGGKVYVVYQGANLDPYLVVFEGKAVSGPYRVGANPLGAASYWDRDDSHGAPALVVDEASQTLRVFWGAHGTRLMTAEASMTTPGAWNAPKTWAAKNDDDQIYSNVTYPQLLRTPDGCVHLFFRYDREFSDDPGNARAVYPKGSWLHAISDNGGAEWSLESTAAVLGNDPGVDTTPETFDTAQDDISWYAHFEAGDSGRIHAVMTGLLVGKTAYARSGVYHMYLDPADGLWKDINSRSLDTTGLAGVERAELEATGTVSAVIRTAEPNVETGPFNNQLSCAEDPLTGDFGMMYLSGSGGFGADAYQWRFASFDGSEWASSTVDTTDHFMDSATLEYRDGTIHAYAVTGGTAGLSDADHPYLDRGGEIYEYLSADGGLTWNRQESPILPADLDRGVIYNDPQLVVGSQESGYRLLFGEWNNDAGNFVHKVYLWDGTTFASKEFFPSIDRLAGASRYEAAVAVSKEGFNQGSDYVVVASGQVFPDALAGVTLAQAYNAPLLLVASDTVPPAVKAEVARLDAEYVIVLGGENTIPAARLNDLKVNGVKQVRRIGGSNRYEVARKIALEVATKRGASAADHAYVVSGEVYPDALSAAPLAAAQGAPLLLASKDGISAYTLETLAQLGIKHTIIVGGPNSVTPAAESKLPRAYRVAGPDRYTTSSAIAELGLLGDTAKGVPASLSMNRFLVASGEVFPDALSGGALAARVRGPVLLTQGAVLSQPTRDLLGRRAYRVLDTYIVGGERTITPQTADEIAVMLQERQYD